MPKICKNEDNLFDLPEKSVVYKTGAVYVTIENIWVTPDNGKQSYTGHKRICIGVVQEDKNGNRTQRFFANQNYFRLFLKEKLSEAHNKSDSLSIDPIFIVKNTCKEYGLIEILLKIFDEKGASLEKNLHGKSCIWFIASILHAVIFNKSKQLRKKIEKNIH